MHLHFFQKFAMAHYLSFLNSLINY
uniref:Uncharacterized protein n=1 Tax=Anguilla anguilla TaxID=7936 RepID=A0A0E9QZZ7_ANGAN